MEISLCMIVKDEEVTIKRCLNSIKNLVDEIIIVDTGSTDKTVEYAKSLGAKVYDFKWIDDFSKARNYSFSKATKDYIFWLDADDILKESDVDKFKELKLSLDKKDVDSVIMNYVLGVDENGETTFSLKRNRLVKRSKNFKWIGAVHEYLEVSGSIVQKDIDIIHKKEKEYTNRNLKIYEKMLADNKEFSPRETFYFANELYDNLRYEEAIKYYEKFLNFKNNWVEDNKQACSKISHCFAILNDKENELKYILKSFEFDIPRADFCCRLGYKFLDENNYDAAIFWYTIAINSAPRKDDVSIISHDTYTYLPWIQLCVCYSKKGDFDSAYFSNEMAAKYKPDDSYIIHNRNYLKDKVSKDIIEKSQNTQIIQRNM
jgi:glycosyltransferase involved in cell wall biosynthesis